MKQNKRAGYSSKFYYFKIEQTAICRTPMEKPVIKGEKTIL